jgi:hypothetical protein
MNPDNRVAVEVERLRQEAKAQREALIARWRAANPDSTCSDAVAFRLADMANAVGRLA